jgi:pimeloyl-ACP methyl ester carboxylesterase
VITSRVLIAVIAVLGVMVAGTFIAYRADLRRAVQRISHGSVVASTPCGPIEYAVRGDGPPVLVVHGAGGGFDQGLLLGEELVARGYRAIAVSRFGYLRTPVHADASPEAQADAHACLLNALGIDRAAVLGVSAGSPSALQFAIRHPQRCTALVLLVPLAWHPRLPAESARAPSRAMRLALGALEHDYAYWLLIRLFPQLATRTLLGTPPQVLEGASHEERERLRLLREQILPVSRRAAGLRMDGSAAATLRPAPLERIEARALVVSLEDDLYGTFPAAQYTASHIPGARFMGFPSGGHVWVGHHREIMGTIADFMRERTREAAAAGHRDVVDGRAYRSTD